MTFYLAFQLAGSSTTSRGEEIMDDTDSLLFSILSDAVAASSTITTTTTDWGSTMVHREDHGSSKAASSSLKGNERKKKHCSQLKRAIERVGKSQSDRKNELLRMAEIAKSRDGDSEDFANYAAPAPALLAEPPSAPRDAEETTKTKQEREEEDAAASATQEEGVLMDDKHDGPFELFPSATNALKAAESLFTAFEENCNDTADIESCFLLKKKYGEEEASGAKAAGAAAEGERSSGATNRGTLEEEGTASTKSSSSSSRAPHLLSKFSSSVVSKLATSCGGSDASLSKTSSKGKLSNNSHLSAGRLTTAGRLSAGRLSTGRLSAGRLSAGRLSTGRLSAIRLSSGRLSAGRTEKVSPCPNASWDEDNIIMGGPPLSPSFNAAASTSANVFLLAHDHHRPIKKKMFGNGAAMPKKRAASTDSGTRA